MANPFDQFDAAPAATGNPFDQFDAPATAGATAVMAGSKPGLVDRLGGVGEAALSAASSAVGAPIAGLAGAAMGANQYIANLLGANGPSAADVAGNTVRNVEDKLVYQPQTESGKAALGIIGAPQAQLAKWGDAIGGKLADAGYPNVGATANAVLQTAPALIGAAAKPSLARAQGEIQAKLDVLKAQNADRDATIQQAQQAGYVFPPDSIAPGGLNGILDGFSGKVKTEQTASKKNAITNTDLTRQEFGLPETAQLNDATYENIRKEAGQAYKAIPAAVPDLQATPTYQAALQNLNPKFQSAKQTFPNQFKNDQVQSLVQDLDLPVIPTDAAIDMIKHLRDQSKTNYNAGRTDPVAKTLGEAQLNAANALEGLIADNLPPGSDLLNNYLDARTTIAKSYAAQKATNNGNVDASVWAKELAKDRPLSGNMQLAGNAASLVPKAMQNSAKIGSVAPISPLDVGVAAMSHAASAAATTAGHGLAGYAGLALLPLRPAVRAAILSKWYQNKFVQPNYTAGSTMLNGADAMQLPAFTSTGNGNNNQ